MRLAVNAIFVGDKYDGITAFADALIENLSCAGHELIVYSSAQRYSQLPGISLRETPKTLRAERGPVANLKRFLWIQASLPGIIKRDRVELILSPNIDGFLRPPIPQMVTVHDLIPLFYRNENPRQYHYYKLVLPRILARADCVLVDSEHTRQDVAKVYRIRPERVVVACHGLPPHLFEDRPGTPPIGLQPGPFFLFVGRFCPRKNLETVIRALASISDQVAEQLVIVAYPDPWMESILRLAGELQVSDRLVLCRGLTDAELAFLYRNATALILLSEYEGLGLPPLEAMAVGTPAIVSNSTSLAEVTGDAAIQVPCRDVAAAAKALKEMSTNPNHRRARAEAGKLHARKYTRQRGIEQTNRALRSLLGESAHLDRNGQ